MVVDSTDMKQMKEAKQELIHVLHERDLIHLPLMIVVNKQDMTGEVWLYGYFVVNKQDMIGEVWLYGSF